MAGNRTIVTRLRAEMQQFRKEWASAGQAVEATEKKIVRTGTSLGKLASDVDNNARAWDVAGKSLLVAGAAMAAGLTLSIKAAIDWESAWTGVLKTVDGSDARLGQLEGNLRRMATQLPASATEIAAVAESAGALGVKTKDIESFTRTMIDLGETTNLIADEAATAIAQIQNVMKTAPEDIDNLGSTLVALGNSGASTEKQILDMAQNIAGAGAIIGLSESDVLALGNALASSGIEAEAGGSAISNVLMDIDMSVKSGNESIQQWADVAGVSAKQFADAWKADPAQALTMFVEGLGRMNEAGGDVFSTLDALGQSDIRVTRALLNMAAGGDLMRKSFEEGNTAWEKNTALADEAAKRYGTTAAQLEIARNKVNDSLISVGEGVLPVVSSAVGGLADIVDGFNALPGPAKSGAGAVLGLGAAAATASGLAVLAVPKLVAFSDAVKLMDAGPAKAIGTRLVGMGKYLMGPWGLALGAAAVGVGLLAKRFGDAAQKQQELRDASADFTSMLDQQTGAITDANRQAAAQKVAQDGTLTWAKLYGISSGKIVEASLGNKKALAEVTSEVEKFNAPGWMKDDFLSPLNDAYAAARKGKGDFKATASALDEVTDAALSASNDGKALNSRLASIGGTAEEARKKLMEMRDSTTQVALSFLDFTKGVDDNKQSFGDWIKGLEDMATAQANWQDNMIKAASLGASDEALAKFTELGASGAKRLEEMVKGGADSVAQFNGIIDDSVDIGERFGGVMEEVLMGIPTELRTVFAVSGDKDAIQKAASVAYEYGLTPEDVRTVLKANDWATPEIKAVLARLDELESARPQTTIGADIGGALSNLAILQQQINNLRGKNVTIGVTGGGAIGVTQANGSILNYYANGGLAAANYFGSGGMNGENRVAQIAPAGAYRVWAEEETGGEAYIPLAGSKRPRSRSIAEQTVRILGGTIEWYANGGVTPSTKLDIKQAQQQVRDIQRSLDETEKYGKKPKKGKDTRPRRRVLRGLDRQIAELQLAEAKRELREIRSNKAYRDDQSEQAADAAQKIADDAADAAEKAESTRLSNKSTYAGNFKIGSLSSTAAVDRMLERTLADAGTFLGLLSDLKSKGASPWLLQQLVDAGPTKGAIKLARQYATDSAALARVNGQAAQIDALTNSYAGLVSNPSFMAPQAWASGVSASQGSGSSTVTVMSLDPTVWAREVTRQVKFEVAAVGEGASL